MYLATTSACLISPVDPAIETPEINHYPHIVLETVQPVPPPSASGVVYADCEGGQLDVEFVVQQVVEYDLDQSLFINWFVDYTPDTFTINKFPFHDPAPIEALGDDPVRDVNQQVRVPLNWLSTEEVAGLHLVEMIVSDAEPLSTGNNPYRSLPEGALSATYKWVVDVTEVGDCE